MYKVKPIMRVPEKQFEANEVTELAEKSAQTTTFEFSDNTAQTITVEKCENSSEMAPILLQNQ